MHINTHFVSPMSVLLSPRYVCVSLSLSLCLSLPRYLSAPRFPATSLPPAFSPSPSLPTLHRSRQSNLAALLHPLVNAGTQSSPGWPSRFKCVFSDAAHTEARPPAAPPSACLPLASAYAGLCVRSTRALAHCARPICHAPTAGGRAARPTALLRSLFDAFRECPRWASTGGTDNSFNPHPRPLTPSPSLCPPRHPLPALHLRLACPHLGAHPCPPSLCAGSAGV